MNTEVGIWLWQPAAQAAERLQQASQRFTAIEAELSRFRPDSGLSRLNAAGRGPQPVLPLLWPVLTAAPRPRRSDGPVRSDAAVCAAPGGYDRSFEQLPPPSPLRRRAAALDWGYQRVRTNPAAMMVELPAGLGP
ncbi:FAD:protein FMN transferase [Candidatus Amarobacter glycogenicus]|uniref:FAD:protein FMN transferase n=1 Tax=Candidatus Amarobacter glycogenicus TaxID=3140699 RepID=UPI003136A45F|nr:FAD:protein FMN transferase [Dehalococcoidia bacterium]